MKVHWESWKAMTFATGKGGMGFEEMQGFNVALLTKMAWRAHQYPQAF